LQVAHDADVAADLGGNLAHHGHARGLIGGRAVREVDAKDVGARTDQLLEDGSVVGGGTECRDDFRASPNVFGTGFWN
jgi:hypothetical protein